MLEVSQVPCQNKMAGVSEDLIFRPLRLKSGLQRATLGAVFRATKAVLRGKERVRLGGVPSRPKLTGAKQDNMSQRAVPTCLTIEGCVFVWKPQPPSNCPLRALSPFRRLLSPGTRKADP